MEEERGTVSALVAVVTVALLVMAGLVADGSTILSARREAVETANAAARAGAQALDVRAARGARRTRIRPDAAVAEARRFLARAGARGRVHARHGQVVVTVRTVVSPKLLTLVGMRRVHVEGRGSARLVRGVRAPET